MISRIRGLLQQITEHHALVENGGIFYEILVPSALADRLKDSGGVGQPITFETIYYIEAGDRKSAHYPRMVGFTDPVDREFFSLFTQVSGMGVKKALKSLVVPIRDIASAIETKDAGALSRLPGVGGRLAEKIIAELHGKTAKFALSKADQPLTRKRTISVPSEREALEVLVQLQYSQSEAKEMIQTATKSSQSVKSVEQLLDVIFKSSQQGVEG